MRYTDPRLSAIPERLKGLKEVLVFASSKGGVGKTLISVATSLLLRERGFRVGLLDIDVTNPTSHLLLGVDPALTKPAEEMGIIPPEVSGVKFMSPVFFTLGRPTLLRGEGTSSAIREMLAITRWVGIDALIVDTPPGMGDELLELLTYVKNFKAMVVTTPSILAMSSAAKLIQVLDRRVEAVVVNMFSGRLPELDEWVSKGLNIPIYTVPYDPEVEEAIGDPGSLLSTKFCKEVDVKLVSHIVRILSG